MSRPHRRHSLRLIGLVLVGLFVARLVRALLGTTSANRDPDQRPVIGSVDTWAPVPRSPAKARGAA